MTTILIHIEKDSSGNAALYASPVKPGANVRFDSGYSVEVRAVFTGDSPFDGDVMIGAGQKEVKVPVRSDALAGHYPFQIENTLLPPSVLVPNLRISVAESMADGVGFAFDELLGVTYLVRFNPQEEQVQVRLENHSGVQQTVAITQDSTSSTTIQHAKTHWHPQPVDIGLMPGAPPQRLSMTFDPQKVDPKQHSPSTATSVDDLGQGGGTQQVDIVVDPDT